MAEARILNTKTTHADPTKLILHESNPRKGELPAIVESFRANGFWGTVIVDERNEQVLAGNHRVMAARELGWDEIPVTYIRPDSDEHALRILLADNRTSDLATYDDNALVQLLEHLASTDAGLDGTGYDDDALNEILSDLASSGDDFGDDAGLADNYSRKIEAPIYTPKGDRPDEADLFDRTRTDALLAEIDAADLPPEVAHFLRNAAERHTVFRFDRIAEYYAHASAEVQELMENSALVIIDFNKAVELGYVKLTEKMLEQAGYAAEADDDA